MAMKVAMSEARPALISGSGTPMTGQDTQLPADVDEDLTR